MRRFMAVFYNQEAIDVAWLIFAVKDAGEAFMLAEKVMRKGVLKGLGKIDGFEIEGLAPRPITEGELAEFVNRVEGELRSREAEGGGA